MPVESKRSDAPPTEHDRYSVGERLRLAAALTDQALLDEVPERARLAYERARQIVDAVARDIRRMEQAT